MLPTGIKLEKQDGNLIAVREKEELAAYSLASPRPGVPTRSRA